ncbi:MAG: metal ABC transporter permease [Alphaproteobacteria bacterium]|nr:metal ABC transporter permease [Rickettsiales bacterium]
MLIHILGFLLLSISAGICGSISVWNKNLFFSHIFAHSLLLPPAICTYIGMQSSNAILICSIIFGVLFGVLFTASGKLVKSDNNTVLLVFSLIIMSASILLYTKNNNVELESYMMGDLIFTTPLQIFLLFIVTVFYIFYLKKYYKVILLNAINTDLATLQNKNISKIITIEIIAQSLLIVLGARMFGSLLISSALIAPAILIKMISKSPFEMVVNTSFLSFIICELGLLVGIKFNTHPASTITMLYGIAAVIIIFISHYLKKGAKNTTVTTA